MSECFDWLSSSEAKNNFEIVSPDLLDNPRCTISPVSTVVNSDVPGEIKTGISKLEPNAATILRSKYAVGNENPEDVFKRVAETYGSNPDHSRRLHSYFMDLWAIPASPILANAGTDRALTISCFLSYVPDSRIGLADHYAETLFMSTNGGGCGADWSDIRSIGQQTSRGTRTSGMIQWGHPIDGLILSANQGDTRKASYAAYCRVSHPEITEFVNMRKPSGDEHRQNLNLHHGVTISDAFMGAVEANEMWSLVDPNSKKMVSEIPARSLWQQILETRKQTGEPYCLFIDQANRDLHPDLKDMGLEVKSSNLCIEIMLPTDEDRSAVCCLSSVNLEFYDDWKDHPTFIEDMVEMLDNVLEDFIRTAPEQLWRAIKSAKSERSIGLGAMGLHSLLQKKGFPFESQEADELNDQIFFHIKDRASMANRSLAQSRGPAKDLKTDRFAHLMAIAPNATTAVIAGVSPSIEPWSNNEYVQPTISGSLMVRNKHLSNLLSSIYREFELPNIWRSISAHDGSVQHLTRLSDHQKAVFKTAFEIDQRVIVKLAADRQKYICQSQSLNLFFANGASISDYLDVHMLAWKSKLKSLYYVKSRSAREAGAVTYDKPVEEGCTFFCQG